MDSQLVNNWAENIKIFLLARQAEMNEIEINDSTLRILRELLNAQGETLYTTLNLVQRHINSQ